MTPLIIPESASLNLKVGAIIVLLHSKVMGSFILYFADGSRYLHLAVIKFGQMRVNFFNY